MLNKLEYPKTLEYSSDGFHLPIEFFMLTVPLAKRIDLKLGYFSSNAIRTLAYGFAQFIYNGGHLRIITNHFLSYKDKVLLHDAESETLIKEDEMKYLINEDIEGLAEILKVGDQHFFNCLKYLLKTKRLEIIPVKLKPNKLAHYKQGILDDGTNQVYFNGSCNFTYKGLIDNGESLSIARSWGEESERLKIEENLITIDNICRKEDPAFEYLKTDQIIEVISKTGLDKNLDELIDDELDICDRLSHIPKLEKTFRNYTSKFKDKIKKEKQKLKFPFKEGPRDYQKAAYDNWVSNNFKGIFAMATGTGKTITALNCLLQEYYKSNSYQAIILVPTIALVQQWEKECKAFNYKNIIKVNSKTKWKDYLASLQALSYLGKKNNFIIISTYASFVKKKFQQEFNKLDNKTLFIADEAHNLGSPSLIKLLNNIHLQYRIGLSATPERQFGESENQKINEFFFETPDTEPYTFEYTMYDAIKKEPKALCPYRYYPKIVKLTDKEFENYVKISKSIVRLTEPRSLDNQKLYELLLLKRQRIIHKASNKIEVFQRIIKSEYERRNNLKFTLIYTPEGIEENNYESYYENSEFSNIDHYIENSADTKLINLYTKEVSSIGYKTTVKQFTGTTSLDMRVDILKGFSNGDIQVITSMKCLDEGVDIPRAELAIFCSSTGNPRQFIQRRGRVLRRHKDKKEATIYDLIVIPQISGTDELYNFERNEIRKELKRVKDFADLSENHYESLTLLAPILEYYNLIL